jgi:hypothetical protein
MKFLGQMRVLRRGSHPATVSGDLLAARLTLRERLVKVREVCVVAMTQRLCVDMPVLIDSVPNELIRESLIGRDKEHRD